MPLSLLIIGTGVAGPTLATLLLSLPARLRPSITLLERSPTLRSQGQNVDVRGAGVGVIRRLGLEATIRASTTDEIGVQWVDGQNRAWSQLEADRTGRVQTGTSDIEILRGRLAEILFEKCRETSKEVEGGVEMIFGDYVQELVEEGEKVHVTFAKSGERRTYDMVVGADGLLSRTRRMVWGEEVERTAVHGLGIWQGFFSMPKGGRDTMWRRWYHTTGRRGVMIRPHERKDMSTVFMYVVNDVDKRFPDVVTDGRTGVEAQKALLAEYFADAGWECPRLVEEMNRADDFYYSPVSQVRMDSWSKGRVVLLGDAGYCASPISGMGTTLALTGAYHLAGAIKQNPDNVAAAFAQYEEKMRLIVDRAQKLPLGGKGFHITNPETWWGLTIMHFIVAFIYWTRLGKILFMLVGPKANNISVEDYGFRQL
ncbi:2-polyprenyl-6-methoxyphenol hydroxylase-like oxidoreductase [Myriangium duriaei CBS 260.36]|uniref:2-polyprenyl-6-methoxyphenol hydroxylase-like oxidoreductase n=1 Tax=Myriangium duriaei CBS 260.36 TaxID=1168546 RepID=A0A9P4MH08_9PEZI|nr:2-polyprenyl-6-methoxyphenol hydroxylase-like oxidoreductase [Myriangium duriaei CBS 260.36]